MANDQDNKAQDSQQLEIDDQEVKPRDPEDRAVHPSNTRKVREKMMDKTLADSYPASDPPSSIPDPGEDDSMACDPDKPKAA